MEFDVKHGPVTAFGIGQRRDGSYVGVAAEGEVVGGPLLRVGNTTSRVDFGCDPGVWTDAWSGSGVGHHWALGTGHRIARTARDCGVARARARRGPPLTQVSVAAVDLGASSGRVLVGQVGDGRLELREVNRFANVPVRVAGVLQWDILALYRGVLDGLRAAGREVGRLDSVGIDSWAVDYGLIDATGALLANPVHYRDDRTDGVMERVLQNVPADELYQITGIQFLPINTLYQLVSALTTPVMAAAKTVLLLPDLISYWLTGDIGAESTNASTTQLLDVDDRAVGDRRHGAARHRRTAVPAVAPAGRASRTASRRRARRDWADRTGRRHHGWLARHGVGCRRGAGDDGELRLHLLRYLVAGRASNSTSRC